MPTSYSFHRVNYLRLERLVMHQSIPAAPIPPGQLWDICIHCQSRGSGISQPQGYPRAFDTTWFLPRDPNVYDFVGKDQWIVTDWLVRQGLDKIVEVFKGMFPRFHAFSPCLPSYNLRNHCLYTEAIMYSAFKTYATISRGGAFALFFHPPPPGNLPPKRKKVLMPGG